MGDRTSIQFKKGTEISVALFHHWGGLDIVKEALKYASDLQAEREGSIMPIDRFEPGIVMVDFIRHLTKEKNRIEISIYLGKDEHDGDNSDNGNWIIDFDDLKSVKKKIKEKEKEYGN